METAAATPTIVQPLPPPPLPSVLVVQPFVQTLPIRWKVTKRELLVPEYWRTLNVPISDIRASFAEYEDYCRWIEGARASRLLVNEDGDEVWRWTFECGAAGHQCTWSATEVDVQGYFLRDDCTQCAHVHGIFGMPRTRVPSSEEIQAMIKRVPTIGIDWTAVELYLVQRGLLRVKRIRRRTRSSSAPDNKARAKTDAALWTAPTRKKKETKKTKTKGEEGGEDGADVEAIKASSSSSSASDADSSYSPSGSESDDHHISREDVSDA